MRSVIVPDKLAATIAQVFGDAGCQWLAGLPALIASLERQWDVEFVAAYPNLTFNFVCRVLGNDGTPLVMKLGVPCPELGNESATLAAYDGRGVVRLIKSDNARGALLLEQIAPGDSLRGMADDDAATHIAASVMLRLRAPLPDHHSLPTVADWGQGFGRLRARFHGSTGPFPELLTARAEALFAELTASSETAVLLHGDLHHDNILRSAMHGWVAIDPKGLAGEPAYEVGSFMRNWMPDIRDAPSPRRLIARRLDIFAAELSLPRQRLRDWSFAQAVLSAWWTIEDGGNDWELMIALASIIEHS